MTDDENKISKPDTNGTFGESGRKIDVEPCENDPCMGDKKQSRMDIFYKYRNELCHKTGLTHKGLYCVGAVVIVSLILLIIVIALGASWPHIPHQYQFPACEEASCLRAAAQIREGLDNSVSPCQDMWSWACGGWLKKYPLPKDRSIWSQKQSLIKNEAARVRDLIATLKLPLHTGSVEWKLKRLYEACLDVDNARNTDEDRPLTSIISDLGGWYILREWNEVDFDSKVIMQNLHVKYGVTPFFKITVEPNPHSPGQNSIRISPSGLGLPNKEYYYRDEDDRIQLAYKELIRDVIIYMSSARIEATKFGNDMFSYEKRIAEITPNPEFLQNPITTYNPVSISELKETVLIQFYDILTAMYPESNITENTEVIVTSLEYLNQISQIIATTDRRTMNGYLMWTLVRTYIPFLSQKFVSTVDTFNAELFGIQQPLPRWEACSQLARRFMSLAVDALIEKTEPTLNSNVTRVVIETFNSILSVVQNRLERFKISSNLQKQLQNKLSTLRLQIGLPRKSMDENFLKMYYQKLKIIKNELFESVRNGMLFLKKLEEQALAHQGVSSLLFNDEATVFYSSSQNTVIIPNSLLRADVFENEYPSPIIYGRLGVEIAHAVVSSVVPFDSFWTADKKILSSFHMTVNESLASVKSNTKCLNNYILNMNVDVPYSVVNETSLWTLKQLAAVDVAHEALTQFLMQKPHTHQPGLDLEDPALFFLTYAQAQCSESTNQHQLYDKIVKFQLPQRTLLHLAWAQLPKFSEALDCSFNKKYMCRDIF